MSLVLALTFSLLFQDQTAMAKGQWIDLTHDFADDAVFWPTADGFHLTVDHAGPTDAGYYYAANSYTAAEHGGTHIDAPIHFAEGQLTVDKIPLQQLIAPAVVIRVAEAAAKNRDYQVSKQDFLDWEAAHGALPKGCIVLLDTGFSKFWPDRERYMGTAERGADAVAKLHFPGLDPDAARWLVAERQISAIGLDTPSIDFGQSKLFESHRTLFAANIPAFENVAHIDKLPLKGAMVVALPMKIRGGSGGPLRIIALLP